MSTKKDSSSSSKKTNIRRRKYLGGLTALGAGGLSSIAGVSAKSNTDDWVTITTVVADGKPVQQKRVPADWWAHEQKAIRARENLSNQLAADQGVKGVGLSTSKDRVANRALSNITVYIRPDGVGTTIPSSVNGIPVTVSEATGIQLDSCNTDFHDPMPGGVLVQSTEGGGTACCEVNYDGYYQMLTCAHIFYDDSAQCNSPDIGGMKAYHADQYFGKIWDYNLQDDWAVIVRMSSGAVSDYDNEIADTAGILSGHVTRDGLLDMKSTGETAYKQAITTCRESGKVEALDVPMSDGCNIDSQAVGLSTDRDGGDSGGPHFKQYTYNGCYYLAIIGVHNGTGNGYNSLSYGAYNLANRTPAMSFDPEFVLGHCK